MAARESNGRFALGNSGGPGRPRRVIERDYLCALSDAVSLDDWREVVQAALIAAKEGDPRARDWLTRYLIGESPLSLTALAADDFAAEENPALDWSQATVEDLRYLKELRERLSQHNRRRGQDGTANRIPPC